MDETYFGRFVRELRYIDVFPSGYDHHFDTGYSSIDSLQQIAAFLAHEYTETVLRKGDIYQRSC
jgi:hypothetical protein